MYEHWRTHRNINLLQRLPWEEDEGIPAIWTTNDMASELYHVENEYGQNHWIIDAEMDCSKAGEDGTFEFNILIEYSNPFDQEVTKGYIKEREVALNGKPHIGR